MNEQDNPGLLSQIYQPQTKLEKEIVSLGPWFHNLHINHKIQTAPNHPLGDFPKYKWQLIADSIPQNLTGWNVLDIGCNAGFYSFELAKRGADVLGVDVEEHYLKQAKWVSGKMKFKGKVSFRKMQIYDIAKLKRKFDLILFMGLFYHLRYPLLALDLVVEKFSKYLVFQTMTMPEEKVIDVPENLEIMKREKMLLKGFPKVAFIEKALSGDYTNWWAPNRAAVEAILRSSGLEIFFSHPGHEIYVCQHSNENPYLKNLVNQELKGVKKGLKE